MKYTNAELSHTCSAALKKVAVSFAFTSAVRDFRVLRFYLNGDRNMRV
ncbi:MAG: hypothetical protein IJ074_05490 [Clostridia bacterium]|nr:hypothetical protein [Clostridia bacterium]MBQ8972516.1 hypothetical protein [Clostridia bacterium]